ncbi:TPA: alpha/beta hydrolase [Legionella pneumophila subsp. pneumophila]|uniref:alpha/beta hydrolase n=1 Tax=Legionella pneumophila TaxID=446 RepID=UPI00026D995B|nr:alpha/beta hydrolase [Legionella pneumophila]CCD08418.1 putative lipase [Legionella pneumophila subsp. pneumophila]CZH42983.1 Alpha/beta hydrolase family [Legionella pneumophila]CZJ96577.1 Alpha/beta hydrolase family [Legionella pneumophila]CZR11389.1 Alpha/beta hydrolase family [Legionella pneumophila]GAN23198.1 alpha/beta hydrolase family protein [Legionella pneumophila]
MLKRVLNTAKAKQPISTTGIFAHTYYWLTSPAGDQSYQTPNYKNEEDNNAGTAIYFIHGTADQPAAFKRVAERLIDTGLPDEICSLNLLAFDQRYQGKSIKFFAEQLKNKIKANQHQRVILMAHSRGGLVASYFAEFLAKEASIEVPLVITVGTPFNGSYLAVKPLSWFSDSIREMEIDSEFLAQLKQEIVEHSVSAYHFFIAKEDAIVPGESGYIKDYVDQYPDSLHILDRHGHLSIMSSHRLVSHIAGLLHDYMDHCETDAEKVKISKLGELTLIEDYYSVKSEPAPSFNP